MNIFFIIKIKVSQKYCNILVVHETQFGLSGYFCQCHESDEPNGLWDAEFTSYSPGGWGSHRGVIAKM